MREIFWHTLTLQGELATRRVLILLKYQIKLKTGTRFLDALEKAMKNKFDILFETTVFFFFKFFFSVDRGKENVYFSVLIEEKKMFIFQR